MVYVIIVTYNGIKWINTCLNSLSGEKAISGIIVIDNASVDGTVDFIAQSFPAVRLIKNNRNCGFGYSNNQGLKIALKEGAEYAFLLNQDAWIENNTITKLVEIHRKNLQYGILSPVHLRGDGLGVDMKFGIFIAQSENYRLFSDLYLRRDEMDEIYSVPFVNAAAWLISRKCLEAAGGFSSLYYHYGEDMSYANRVRFHGFRLGVCPATVIYHDRINSIEYPDMNFPKRYLAIKRNLHLIYLADINRNFLERYLKSLFKLTNSICRFLIRLELKKAGISFRELGILLGVFPKVLKNTSIVKKKNGAFLLDKSRKTKLFQRAEKKSVNMFLS